MKDGTALIAPFVGLLVRFLLGGFMDYAKEQQIIKLKKERDAVIEAMKKSVSNRNFAALKEQLKDIRKELALLEDQQSVIMWKDSSRKGR